jgi:hypothetical protein
MDIQRIGKVTQLRPSVSSEIRFMPEDIDPDGLKILEEAGFVWDSRLLAFHRIPTGHPGGPKRATIEYGFLRDQKLLLSAKLREHERIGQLQRLRILVQSLD